MLADQRVKAGGPKSTGQLLFRGLQSSYPQMAQVLPNRLQPLAWIQKLQRTPVLLPPKDFMHMSVQHLSCYLALYRHHGCLAGGHHCISCWGWFGTGRCQRAPCPEGLHVCMWKPGSLYCAGTSVYTNIPSHQVKMFLARKCFLFPWNAPYP